MMKTLKYVTLLVLCVILASCGGKNKRGIFTPSSSGRAYEILVVVNQNVWQRPAGRALYDVLYTDVPGLPQPEASFRMMYTDPSNFDATLKMIRNIVMVEIDSKQYTQPKFKFAKDVYAYPQVVLSIQAPDEDSFAQFVTENRQVIIDFFTHAEMNRQIALLENSHSDYISQTVKEMFDCDIWVSGELGSHKTGEDFLWAGSNTATNDQNFVIYSFPYRDKDTFTKDYFVHKRDSVMKVNIPGAREGMYMTTDSLLTDARAIAVQGEYCLEVRGLWKVKGDMMGGPFVSHMRLDKQNQRVIVAEIFVYSPDKKKRNLVRQLEASLYTLRLPGTQQEGNAIPLKTGEEQKQQ